MVGNSQPICNHCHSKLKKEKANRIVTCHAGEGMTYNDWSAVDNEDESKSTKQQKINTILSIASIFITSNSHMSIDSLMRSFET
jgi:hypothetical protein